MMWGALASLCLAQGSTADKGESAPANSACAWGEASCEEVFLPGHGIMRGHIWGIVREVFEGLG